MNADKKLQKHLSPLNVWAFAVGTSIGWGSLVVTASAYLSQGGPIGSVLGLTVGALIMIVISQCYSYLMKSFPEAGGAYCFAREAFGNDYGFLTAWFLLITYMAMLWANATSIPLFFRIFVGDIFEFGKMYTLFGYDVYFGEALLTMAAILVIGFICANQAKLSIMLMTGMALIFSAGIVVCFISSVSGIGPSIQMGFVPDASAISQVIKIAVISPWAYIGFESVSHGTEEFDFKRTTIGKILIVSVITTLVLYTLVILLSVSAYPAEYSSWFEYIADHGNLSGLKALPAFYAAHHYMGDAGVWILMLSLLCLVVTSLIGNLSALSRLLYSMANEGIIASRYGELNKASVPSKAVWLIAGLSCLIAFTGRTAIGWIVDVTNICAVLIYGLVAASAYAVGKRQGDRREKNLGSLGLIFMLALGAYLILHNLVTHGSLESETYFLFIVWSVLGFLFFRSILMRDKEHRFGNSIVVWIALLALVLLIALIWMRQSMITSNSEMMTNVNQYYEESKDQPADRAEDAEYVQNQMKNLDNSDTRTMLMSVGMFMFALVIMLNNHSYMSKRSKENEALANTDPMTGVKNKHAWLLKEKELDDLIAEKRAPEFSIVLCDVNGLKKINDTLGHKAGDEYIKEACKMVCEIYQKSPVYRIGGDEFVVLLTGTDHTVRKELKQLMHDRSVEHISEEKVVISAGMSDFDPEKDQNAHEPFERADSLMYEEKKLLKGLGSVTRDEEPESRPLVSQTMQEKDTIIKIRRNVLVIEDGEVNRMMLGEALKGSYDLLYARDGVEGFRMILEHKDELALVLLDLNLPLMSGMDILKKMRKDPDVKNVPVIVMTADQDAEVECLKLGAMDFISKPYPSWEIVLARVNKCIELAESSDIIQSTERDKLTGLFNYDYFNSFVKMYDQHYFDLAMDAVVIDIDHFHIINDRYGKAYGDTVLRSVGSEIRRFARETGGVAGRKDADVFHLYCPYREDYMPLLDRVSERLEEDGATSGRIRLHVGVYSEVDKSIDIEHRFERARAAANQVKGNLTRPIGFYDQKMHEEEMYKERLLEDFRTSIRDHRFMVYLQPKFNIRPEKPMLTSAEALVRWNHPEFGLINPVEFIPLLEENGLILELDKFVWKETAARIRYWKENLGFKVPVSVNVSRIDMLMPNLKDIFMEIINKEGLTTRDIVLEITESAYSGESDQIISMARELQGMDMGFRIEMDDFGTGYSSLSMLSRLPVDALKLDMSFIRNAFEQSGDTRMIELIIDIADYLHVPVVAEGVETEEQYKALKKLGCDLIQGYYFSKPVPSEEFDKFILERKEAE